MENTFGEAGAAQRQAHLLTTLEGLLAIDATDVRQALNQASQIVNEMLGADKSEVFLYDPSVDTLVSSGVSDTPMARQQVALGLDRLAVSNGGITVQVFQSGESFSTGHLEREPDELRGIVQGLGVRSTVAVALDVNGARRGVVQISSAQPEQFAADDTTFLNAVSHWIALLFHRAELVQRIAEDAAEQARRRTADELITILAHDLRAPLTALKGRAMLLQMRADREAQAAYQRDATAVTVAANRLDHMITDLLDTARLEQGIFRLSPSALDLVALTRETATTLQVEPEDIEVRAPDELVMVGDPDRIRQALENVLSNAITHSPPGVAVIADVSAETRADGTWAIVQVRDAGPGIAPELLPRLFERFSAGTHTRGLGLGLYLARGIATAHGGTLTVESAPGAGTTFCLALPMSAAGE